MDAVGRRRNIERKTRPTLLAQNKSICYPSPFAFNSCHGNRETRTGFPNWIRKKKKKMEGVSKSYTEERKEKEEAHMERAGRRDV